MIQKELLLNVLLLLSESIPIIIITVSEPAVTDILGNMFKQKTLSLSHTHARSLSL